MTPVGQAGRGRRFQDLRPPARLDWMRGGRAPIVMSDITLKTLLTTSTVEVRDVCCPGRCRHRSAEECARATQLVFPYRGVYVRHVGRDEAVAEASQVMFFNAGEGYRVSHPVAAATPA